MKKSVYGLTYDDPVRGAVVFYVGCTNDVVRRTQEHMRNPFVSGHAEYDTYKYRFCRDLADLDITYSMVIIEPAVDVADDSDEYSWILQTARINQDLGIKFYQDLPLTNMRAGDFLDEMIRDRTINSSGDIRAFKQRREQERNVTYERTRDSSNPVARAMLDQIEIELAPARALKQEQQAKRTSRARKQQQTQAEWLAEQEQLWAQYRAQETQELDLTRFEQFKEQQ